MTEIGHLDVVIGVQLIGFLISSFLTFRAALSVGGNLLWFGCLRCAAWSVELHVKFLVPCYSHPSTIMTSNNFEVSGILAVAASGQPVGADWTVHFFAHVSLMTCVTSIQWPKHLQCWWDQALTDLYQRVLDSLNRVGIIVSTRLREELKSPKIAFLENLFEGARELLEQLCEKSISYVLWISLYGGFTKAGIVKMGLIYCHT